MLLNLPVRLPFEAEDCLLIIVIQVSLATKQCTSPEARRHRRRRCPGRFVGSSKWRDGRIRTRYLHRGTGGQLVRRRSGRLETIPNIAKHNEGEINTDEMWTREKFSFRESDIIVKKCVNVFR